MAETLLIALHSAAHIYPLSYVAHNPVHVKKKWWQKTPRSTITKTLLVIIFALRFFFQHEKSFGGRKSREFKLVVFKTWTECT